MSTICIAARPEFRTAEQLASGVVARQQRAVDRVKSLLDRIQTMREFAGVDDDLLPSVVDDCEEALQDWLRENPIPEPVNFVQIDDQDAEEYDGDVIDVS